MADVIQEIAGSGTGQKLGTVTIMAGHPSANQSQSYTAREFTGTPALVVEAKYTNRQDDPTYYG